MGLSEIISNTVNTVVSTDNTKCVSQYFLDYISLFIRIAKYVSSSDYEVLSVKQCKTLQCTVSRSWGSVTLTSLLWTPLEINLFRAS